MGLRTKPEPPLRLLAAWELTEGRAAFEPRTLPAQIGRAFWEGGLLAYFFPLVS